MRNRQTSAAVRPQLTPQATATGAKTKQAIANSNHSRRTQSAITVSYSIPFRRRKGSFGLRREAVTRTSNGLDQTIVTGQFQRYAQTANVHVHRALLDQNVVPPYLIEQLGATMYAFSVRHEKMQQAKF